MTNHKKLGLLLLPLVPLTAIGIVEVASAVVVPDTATPSTGSFRAAASSGLEVMRC